MEQCSVLKTLPIENVRLNSIVIGWKNQYRKKNRYQYWYSYNRIVIYDIYISIKYLVNPYLFVIKYNLIINLTKFITFSNYSFQMFSLFKSIIDIQIRIREEQINNILIVVVKGKWKNSRHQYYCCYSAVLHSRFYMREN